MPDIFFLLMNDLTSEVSTKKVSACTEPFFKFPTESTRKILKKNFEEKSLFLVLKKIFGVGNLKSGSSVYLKFYVDSDAKRIRALAAIPKSRQNKNAQVDHCAVSCGFMI